jgi:ATP-dependent Lon protease
MPVNSRYELYAARYPVLPLRQAVIFPHTIVTLLIGKPRSIQALEAAASYDGHLIVVGLRDADCDEPAPGDVFEVGTLARILAQEPRTSGGYEVRLEGRQRVRLLHLDTQHGYLLARAEPLSEPQPPPREAAAQLRYLRTLLDRYCAAGGHLSDEILSILENAEDLRLLTDMLASHIIRDMPTRQRLLELLDPLARIEQLAILLAGEVEISELEQRIKDRVREHIDRTQREFYLREQLKVIYHELSGETGSEADALRQRIQARSLPNEVAERLLREVDRLEHMPNASAESAIVRTYIETLLALPWTEETTDNLDLEHAQAVLEREHYGLEHVKERILEFLAVRKLTAGRPPTQATVLCFVGPPGVGKTSLGRAIAQALGRTFARVSLGGVRDEAEIRGHRRTYIGAYPGRIITAMRRAGTINPVIVLDEIDKLASDYRGDPAAALLEVLDPEQNQHFTDHYLDVPYDLSRVLFIATANTLATIPRALRDRLEVIEIEGYTEEEKREIGRRHLLPRQLAAHGLSADALELPEPLWPILIRGYTYEAGVRELDRQLAALCRKIAREAVQHGQTRMRLTKRRLLAYLGPPRYDPTQIDREPQIGVAIGLGTTAVGGALLPVEVAVMPGKGRLHVTGQAGEVMQESARAALSFVRSRATSLGIPPERFEQSDIHIHLPEGAQPKDGPSAGITMAIAMISAFTERPVRADLALTGEITLRGRILPIGGLREKALAAQRAGIRHIVAPAENARELPRIPASVIHTLTFHWVRTMDDVIALALLPTQPSDVLAGTELAGKAAPPLVPPQSLEDDLSLDAQE